MVKSSVLWIAVVAGAACAACGPGLRDGAYQGDPRFTVAGTLENIAVDANQSTASLRMTVLWQMVAPPADTAPTTTVGTEPASGAEGAPGTAANPNGSASAPQAPQAPTTPTISGQQGGAVNVAFPAPVSLTLYDIPLISGDAEAWQAEGTVIIYYDVNGDGQYDAGDESIAATLQDHRLLFSADTTAVDASYVDSILDNPATTPAAFTLATRRCDGAVEHLTAVQNTNVTLVPGAPVACE